MKVLNSKKVIFWDFDGVIIESEEIRIKGFKRVLIKYPASQVNELLAFHTKNGGLSRYIKFRYFFEDIRKENISEIEIQRLAEEFSVIMLEELPNSNLLIQDSLNFISNHFDQFKMHIVSGSDHKELNSLCNSLRIAGCFDTICGSPTPKPQLVKNLMDENKYEPENCVLIGDSINDYHAALENGIDFYGFNNRNLKTQGFNYIESFE